MTMTQALRAFYWKRLDFQSRSRRSEFWWLQLAFICILLGAAAFDFGVLGYSQEGKFPPLNIFVEVVIFVPAAALTARRLHDVGLTGWAQLPLYLTYMSYVPGYEDFIFSGVENGGAELALFIVFAVYSIWLLFNLVKDGQSDPNRYGDNPKELSLSDVFD